MVEEILRGRWFSIGLLSCVGWSVPLLGCDRVTRQIKKLKRGSASVPKAPKKTRPAKLQPPLRKNVATGRAGDDAVVMVRLFVSKLSTKDPLHFLLTLQPSVPFSPGAHPWAREHLEPGSAHLPLRFEISRPDKSVVTLQRSGVPKRSMTSPLAHYREDFSLDGRGLNGIQWQKPALDLFKYPGRYTLTVSGELPTNKRTLRFKLKAVPFEIVDKSEGFWTLEEISKKASARAMRRLGLPTPPKRYAGIVDDISDNRWLRFQARGEAYTATVVELLFSPRGKELFVDQYEHFTCVAEKTAILVPGGERLVEDLRVGDQVVAFDVERKRRVVAPVLAIERSYASRLVQLGDLRVTPMHPVYADGRWQPAFKIGVNTKLLSFSGTGLRLRPRHYESAVTVFDLSVGAPHTYFAGGILVHNKAAVVPIGGKPPWGATFFRRAARL